MSKIIFLDIDGVLNSNFWNNSHQKEISDGTLIDEDKVILLSELVKSTGARIVLHSGWKFWFDAKLQPTRNEALKLVQMLRRQDLSIFDVTPDFSTEEIRRTKKFSLVKANEILEWISSYNDAVNWIVIDDLDLHNAEIANHKIKTNPNVGLKQDDVNQAKDILNNLH